jgi:hypothetical protein
MAEIRREKAALEEQLRGLRLAPAPGLGAVDERLLDRACREVDRWLDEADDAERQLALEALQIGVTANREQATVSGLLPLDPAEFLFCNVHRHALWVLQNQNTQLEFLSEQHSR